MNRVASGRPRKFDEVAVLDLAMNSFWRGGFHGTSYDDLEKATGLRRQSLIYAFGDKRTMFDKVIAHYISARVEGLVAILDDPRTPAPDRIQAAFKQWIADASVEDQRGCLVVNTIAELGGNDADVSAKLEEATVRLRAGFARCLRAGQAEGTISRELDSDALAALAVAAGDGAMLHSRVSADVAAMSSALAAFLQMIRAL